jgi:hypothetical protein
MIEKEAIIVPEREISICFSRLDGLNFLSWFVKRTNDDPLQMTK